MERIFLSLNYPPFAKMLCVPIMTVFTLDIVVKIAESGINVTSNPTLDKFEANS